MDKLKQYVVFTVLGCLVVLAAGWFLLVSPKRSDAAALRASAEQQVSANSALQTQLQVLKAQAKALPKEQAKLAAVAAKIPDNPALPGLIRALTAAAVSTGVELVSVTPSAPVVVGATPGAPAAAPAAAAPAGAAPAAAGAAGVAGTLTSIPVNLNVVGAYFDIQKFMGNVENLARSMRVSNLAIALGQNPVKPAKTGTVDDGRSLSATVTAQVFMAANRPAATAVTVPGQAVAGTAVRPVAPVTPAKK
jgi:type IV pilus assembly protein PilO